MLINGVGERGLGRLLGDWIPISTLPPLKNQAFLHLNIMAGLNSTSKSLSVHKSYDLYVPI